MKPTNNKLIFMSALATVLAVIVSRKLPMALVVTVDRDMAVMSSAILYVNGQMVGLDISQLQGSLDLIAVAHKQIVRPVVTTTTDPGQADFDSIYNNFKR